MPNWNQILKEVHAEPSKHDSIRRKYLRRLHRITGRNVIAYYSGWLQKQQKELLPAVAVTDEDKNGFMTTVNRLDRSKGLDLFLHTPGGDTAATESLVHYLRSVFATNVRAIVPQLALSAGTMIACSCKEIMMGRQSSLGPIDPQFGDIAAHGVIEEFKRAHDEIKKDPSKIPLWQPVIAKYPPAFIGKCEKAVEWSEQLVREWLQTNMFAEDKDAAEKIKTILAELGHELTLSHGRHLSMDKCRDMGLKIAPIEDDPKLQDAVLSVHHACMVTLAETGACKIIENHLGTAFIKMMQLVVQKG